MLTMKLDIRVISLELKARNFIVFPGILSYDFTVPGAGISESA